MQINRGFRQGIVSALVFAGVIAGLMSVDPRVNEQMQRTMFSSSGIASWDDRVVEAGRAVITAVRYQSIDNAPLMVFAAVGAVLFVFMFKA